MTIACALGLLLYLRRSAGRLAPRVAIAPLAFLVTRWPVLATWAVGAVGSLAYFVHGMQAKGLDSAGHYALALAMALICGGGLAVLVVGPLFLVARAFAPAPALPLADGEVVRAQQLASHFLRGEARGGTLLVTSRRLAFRPHRFNVQLATWSLPLQEIERIDASGDRLLLVHPRASTTAEWILTRQSRRVAETIERASAASATGT